MTRTTTGFFSRLANIRLVAAVNKVRSTEGESRRVPGEPATMDVREVQPSRGVTIVATHFDYRAERLDAVAGSEFVDDRIRRRE